MKKRLALFAALLTVTVLVGVIPIEKLCANPTTLSWFRITIESPKDIAYYPTDTISLNISVEINEVDPEITSYYYNLDSNNYVNSSVKFMEVQGKSFEEFNGTYFVNGSAVLPSLPVGMHKVTVFRGGNDSFGHFGFFGTPDSVHITIEPEPFPIIAVLITVVTIAVLSAVSLVYFKRRRGKP